MKIKFHFTYLLMAFSFVICGYFVNLIIFTFIILFHELGHFIMAKINSFDVKSVTIYPYGGLINLNIRKNVLIRKELVVACGGILFQVILMIIVRLLYVVGIVRLYVYNIFIMYNSNILFFNLLPITSLDGSKILCLLFYYFFPYKYVLKLELYISIFVIGILFFINLYRVNYSFIIISFVVFSKIILCYKNIHYNFLSFLMERYLYNYKFNRYKVIDNINDMYRERSHIFIISDKQISEKDFLYKKFNGKIKKMFD